MDMFAFQKGKSERPLSCRIIGPLLKTDKIQIVTVVYKNSIQGKIIAVVFSK